MATQGEKILSSWLTEQYNRLNALRTKTSLSTIAVPSENGNTITAKNISDLNDQLDAFHEARSAWYAKNKDYLVNKGSLISISIDTDLDTLFDTWENVCYGYNACPAYCPSYTNCPSFTPITNTASWCPAHVCPYGDSGCPENIASQQANVAHIVADGNTGFASNNLYYYSN